MAREAGSTLDSLQGRATLPAEHPLCRSLLAAGGAGLLACAVAWGVGEGLHGPFLQGYLVAYLFWLTVALGGLFFVLCQHLCRAGWSVVVRRLAEQVGATLPLFALLFVPIALGRAELFHWAHPGAMEADPLLRAKAAFLDEGRFLLRAAVYLAFWSFAGWWLRAASLRQDAMRDAATTRRLQAGSAPAMALFAVTLTLASFDWVMSLDPHWYSTIFGVYVFSGAVVAILALLSLGVVALGGGPLARAVTAEHRHDLGKLLFAFVVFWAYIAFSQFMLIWYGNLPEETVWFAHRWEHGWMPVSVALAVGHFGVPFFFLLGRDAKRHRGALAAGAGWLLAMHYLDLYWLVIPALRPGPAPALADALAFVGVGGLFLGTLGLLLRGRSLIPVGDPRLGESLAFENA